MSKNLNRPTYSIERYPLGWAILQVAGMRGIPMDALSECSALCGENAEINHRIGHYLKENINPNIIFCITTPENSRKWIAEIEAEQEKLDPQDAWWLCGDVGLSSAAIYSALTTSFYSQKAREFSQGSTPRDNGDFQRCLALLKKFPDWEGRLGEVAEAFGGDTTTSGKVWKAIAENFSALKNADSQSVNTFLRAL